MVMEDRIQRVVTQILGDMSLTEDMDDAQASVLLDWGSSTARHLALTTIDLEDEQAYAVLDPHLTNLRRTMRRVNKLFANLDGTSADELVGLLGGVFESLGTLPGKGGGAPDLAGLAQQIAGQPPGAVLAIILPYL